MILIKQVKIIDGSGKKSFKADIFIRDKKISAIGDFSGKKADMVINGLGLVAVPGFIDVNTDSDHHLTLFTNPSQKDFTDQGVTTTVGGQCGVSLAPLMYGSLASIREWAYTDQVNVGWRSIKEFFNILQRINLGVRFESLVGYSTIRTDIAGEEQRDLTDSEMQIFIRILEEALKDGALGLSTGLSRLNTKTTPYVEIKALAGIVAKFGKIYATHLRDEKEGLLKSIEETLNVARDTGVKTIISHLRPVNGFEDDFEKALELIDKSLVDTNVYFDVSPFATSLVPIYSLLPEWAQGSSVEMLLNYIDKKEMKNKIMNKMASLKLDDFVIVSAKNNESLIGKNLKEVAENRGKSILEFLIDMMRITYFSAVFATKNLNEKALSSILFHPRSLVGSNSASFPEKTKILELERSTSTFTKFLEIAKEKNIQMEEAVKKITWTPAQIYGFKNRGLIKEGYLADIVLLKDDKVDTVIINGARV